MRNLFWIVPLAVLTAGGGTTYASAPGLDHSAVIDSPAGSPREFGAELDIGFCYTYLAPYGTWVRLEPYGYVWRPRHMGYRWRPYSEGHWVWTDYGWTWIDDAEWGWVPFHYGRWGWDDDFGWYWVPGTEWGPAWVAWRWNDMYMGWAPIPPGIDIRAGMNFASLSMAVPARFWVFVNGPHFLDADVRPNVLPYERNATIVSFTVAHDGVAFRDNAFVNEGAGIDVVRRITRRDVPRFTVEDSPQPGPTRIVGSGVRMYRPSFRGNPGARPSDALSIEQARRELAPAKVYEPRQQAPERSTESAVRARQAEERAVLQKSQAQDLKDVQRQRAEEARRAQDASARAKVQQEYRARGVELQRQQQAERQQLSERQKKDAAQVRQAQQARKQPPQQKGESARKDASAKKGAPAGQPPKK